MANEEDLVRALQKLTYELQTIDGRLQSGLNGLSERLKVVENQVSEIGSGLAVVLNRSHENRVAIQETKKNSENLPNGMKSWLNSSLTDLQNTMHVLQKWRER